MNELIRAYAATVDVYERLEAIVQEVFSEPAAAESVAALLNQTAARLGAQLREAQSTPPLSLHSPDWVAKKAHEVLAEKVHAHLNVRLNRALGLADDYVG
ncbi:MAG: hypothetical protein NVSMB2_26110 [Chloroflexota bacterium]